jgi:HlyD family type I secretion membrane fusion protein
VNKKVDSQLGGQQNGLPRARARFLAQAIQLEEEGSSDTVRNAIFFSFFLLFAVIVWMTVTEVNEMSVSRGEVIPAGYVHNIQHLEGGIVSEVAIHNGDSVDKGDLLVGFAPPATRSEYGQLASRRATLVLSLARLHALEVNEAPEFGELGKEYPDLAKRQLESYWAQAANFKQELSVISAQINQKASELTRQLNQVNTQKKEVSLLKEQVVMRQKLAVKHIVSEADLLSRKSDLASAESQLKSIKDSVLVAKMALKESKERLLETRLSQKKELKLEASVVAGQLAELEGSLIGAEDKLNRLNVYAPVSGIIQGLSIASINEVVRPGDTILQVVPVDDDLVVEARISPSEVGYIHSGLKAEIKVDSYDSSRFGVIKGRVKQVSPSTYLDEKMNPYYKATIELEKSYIGSDPEQMKVIPGMTVSADIITGSKTIMAYLLKPVSRGFSEAFKEH